MKRRDFNRLVLGAGATSAFAKSSLAQMSAEELQNPPAKTAAPSIIIKNSPRTYNQVNVPRKYVAGKRRFTIYWTWSYPWEANRDVTELDNRFSTMTEVRRVGWPRYEGPEWSAQQFLQGIAVRTVRAINGASKQAVRSGRSTVQGIDCARSKGVRRNGAGLQ